MIGTNPYKLSQILATRYDLLSDKWVPAFDLLQSGVPILPFSDLQAQVDESLGELINTAFAEFDAAPLAAASIAQVHCARLPNGTDVVVKIRRPAIHQRMAANLRLIFWVPRAIKMNLVMAQTIALLPHEMASDSIERGETNPRGN